MYYKFWKFEKQGELENYMHNVITVLQEEGGIETIISTNHYFSYDFRIHDPITHQLIDVCIDDDAFVTGFSIDTRLAWDSNHRSIMDRVIELFADKNPLMLEEDDSGSYADKVLSLKKRRDYIESTLERS